MPSNNSNIISSVNEIVSGKQINNSFFFRPNKQLHSRSNQFLLYRLINKQKVPKTFTMCLYLYTSIFIFIFILKRKFRKIRGKFLHTSQTTFFLSKTNHFTFKYKKEHNTITSFWILVSNCTY
jgi:hypothetical protein